MGPMATRSRYGAVIAALALFGAGLMLAGGVYAANYFTKEDAEKADVSVYPDDANDRLVVKRSEPGSDWSTLTVSTNVPARVSLGLVTLTTGPDSLSFPPKSVVDGESLNICALGSTEDVKITLRDEGSDTVVSDRTMNVRMCGTVPDAEDVEDDSDP
jgi:hypothetical protein